MLRPTVCQISKALWSESFAYGLMNTEIGGVRRQPGWYRCIWRMKTCLSMCFVSTAQGWGRERKLSQPGLAAHPTFMSCRDEDMQNRKWQKTLVGAEFQDPGDGFSHMQKNKHQDLRGQTNYIFRSRLRKISGVCTLGRSRRDNSFNK